MEIRTLHDVYRCPHCASIAAHGNSYCRGCGVRFSDGDIKEMKNNKKATIGALPWNIRDRFRCVRCSEFISIKDKYCRACGVFFDAEKTNLMKKALNDLGAQNTPAKIGFAVFVIVVIVLSILNIKG